MSETNATPDAEAVQDTQTAPPAETGDSVQETGKPDSEKMVPEAALAAARAKSRELEKELSEFREKQQEQEDAKQRAEGDIAAAQEARKAAESEAQEWRDYATEKLETLTGGLEDADKAILDDLGDVSLSKRLAVAEKLAARTSQESGAGNFGPGPTPAKKTSGKIPPEINSRGDYVAWMNSLSHSAEGMKNLRDSAWYAAVTEEARARNLN